LPGFGKHTPVGGDAIASKIGLYHTERQLDSVIGAPGYKIISTGCRLVAIGITADQRDIRIAADL
jgi:hypothetical protein